MKISKLLIIVLLASCSLFSVSSAKASTLTAPKATLALFSWSDLLNDLFGGGSSSKSGGSGSAGSSGSSGSSSSASLPINNNIWFLVIASAAIGGKVIINKSKEAKAQTVKA